MIETAGKKVPHVRRDEEDEHDGDDELRQGTDCESDDRHEVIDDPVAAERRDDAEGDAEHRADHAGQHDKGGRVTEAGTDETPDGLPVGE